MAWADDSPYYLILLALERNPVDGSLDNLTIDVGEPGWTTTHADWLRRPAEWYLIDKNGDRAVLAQVVYAGEQPYYVRRHVGQSELNTGRHREISAYGIGKKVPAVFRQGANGRRILVSPARTDRVWILPHGVVCGGEDVERLAMAIVTTMEWAAAPEPTPEEQPVVVDSAP